MLGALRFNPVGRIILRYALAVVACMVALLLRMPLSVFLKGDSPFIAFTPAILFAARFGGIGPGLVATAMSGLLGAFFLFEPYESFSIEDPKDVSQMTLLITCGGLISYLGESTRSARERARTKDRALRQSEERFHQVVEGITECAIFMLDDAGRIISWNSGARRLKGYTFDEVVGRHFSLFYTSEDIAAGVPDQILRRAKEEGTVHEEGWCVRRDGSRFWGEAIISAVRDEGNALRGFVKITRDTTEQKLQTGNQASLLTALVETRDRNEGENAKADASTARRPGEVGA